MPQLESVITQAKTIKTLESILDVLTWDQETMMPPGANDHRTEQKMLLAGIIHEKKQDPSYFDQVAKLSEKYKDENSDTALIVTKLHEDLVKARKLPTSFVTQLTQETSFAFEKWQQARKELNWKLFEPHMERLVALMQEKAALLGYKEHPLDPLLDLYEPQATVKKIEQFFTPLKEKLLALFKKIQASPLYNQKCVPLPSTDSEQEKLTRHLISLLGFDWNYGRLDRSEHPFSTAFHPTDSRLTIRARSNDLLNQISSALHETGHGLYEMGLSKDFYGTPLCESVSLSIHESQSRFFETIIGQSRSFSIPLYRILKDHFGEKMVFSSPEYLYKHINNVVPSPIRTQADEVTYPLHVILRFEIEKELLENKLSVKDLPERWNSMLYDLLGIHPKNIAEGCLQDVHWSLGSFGYFPTYTLGSFYAICFGQAMRKEIPHFDSLIEKTTFLPILTWLKDHVWKHGRRYTSQMLVEKALGRTPTEDEYISYLENKYCHLL